MQKLIIGICILILFSIFLFASLSGNGKRSSSRGLSDNYIETKNHYRARQQNRNRSIVWENKSTKRFKNRSYGSEKFDFYEPRDQENLSHPLVIVLHSGAFITGSKRDREIVELSEIIASNGYKVAAIDYQLIPKPTDLELIKNSYRFTSFCKEKIFEANQDLSLAVRYFRDSSDAFKVDAESIFVIGYSAGAIVSLNTVFLDSGDFNKYFDLENACLHCNGSTSSDFKVKGVVAIGGAMFDPLAIDNNDTGIKALLIHGQNDDVVSIGEGRPFDKYFDKDFSLELPSLSYELSIDRENSKGEEEAWIFKLPHILSVPKIYLQTLQKSVLPNLFGPKVLEQRMKSNGVSVDFTRIRGAKHNLFYNQDGTNSNHSKILTKKIIRFLNANN